MRGTQSVHFRLRLRVHLREALGLIGSLEPNTGPFPASAGIKTMPASSRAHLNFPERSHVAPNPIFNLLTAF